MATAISLPTPRQFLTSLLNTLTVSPPVPPVQLDFQIRTEAGNPLKTISQQQKALLATMHVLFPPPMLLQALDLLDRGLVGRFVLREESGEEGGEVEGGGGGEGEGGDVGVVEGENRGAGRTRMEEERREEGDGEMLLDEVPTEPAGKPAQDQGISPVEPREQEHEPSSPPWPPSYPRAPTISPITPPQPPPIQAPLPLSQEPLLSSPSSPLHPKPITNLTPAPKTRQKTPQIHQVSSSQPSKSRFHNTSASSTGIGTGTGTGTLYAVRLEAWNCSCVAFAFSCYPSSSTYSSKQPWNHVLQDEDWERRKKDRESRRQGQEEEDDDWEFGGLSLDGKGGESVPMCKHLLACLLAERWSEVLGRYVKVREVSRDEMAGLGGEG